MAITLPIFNVLADVWYSPNTPAGSAPDFLNMRIQIYVNSRGMLDIQPGAPDDWVPPVYVRIDPAFRPLDVGIWIFAIPATLPRFYRVRWKEIAHLGFPNEYDVFLCGQCDDTGAEIRRDVP